MRNVDLINSGRREFLWRLPSVAAAGFALTDAPLLAASAPAESVDSPGAGSFQLFAAQQIQDDINALQANPGNKSLVDKSSFTVALTTEKAKSASEFEWHEHRDHVFQILEGSTVYELGGTPQGARSDGPGEWHAPESVGASTLTLHKGDMLVVPRGTPHKRTTRESVTLMLISPQGTA
jgi:mannose-6-phosphate isomerase-like protein (cupin superfamily)